MKLLDQVRRRAVQLLARRTHSSRELSRKLQRRYPPELVEEIIEELSSRGYLDDEKAAIERALHCRRARHFGDRRIAADLTARGIDAKIIDVALARTNRKFSESECLERLVSNWVRQKGRPETARQLKRLFDHAQRRGFPAALVRRVLEPYFEGVAWPNS